MNTNLLVEVLFELGRVDQEKIKRGLVEILQDETNINTVGANDIAELIIILNNMIEKASKTNKKTINTNKPCNTCDGAGWVKKSSSVNEWEMSLKERLVPCNCHVLVLDEVDQPKDQKDQK